MRSFQAPAPGSAGQDAGEAAIQLNALIDHQRVATVQLINTEAQLSTWRAQTATAAPKQRAVGIQQLHALEGAVQGLKADLATTRERIREIRR